MSVVVSEIVMEYWYTEKIANHFSDTSQIYISASIACNSVSTSSTVIALVHDSLFSKAAPFLVVLTWHSLEQ